MEDKKQKKLEHGGKKHKQKRVPQATKLLRNDNKVFSMQSDENLPFSSQSRDTYLKFQKLQDEREEKDELLVDEDKKNAGRKNNRKPKNAIIAVTVSLLACAISVGLERSRYSHNVQHPVSEKSWWVFLKSTGPILFFMIISVQPLLILCFSIQEALIQIIM